MKPLSRLALFLTLAAAACAPSPPPRPAPPPAIVATPAPAMPNGDWRDLPETPGSWAYVMEAGGSAAIFAPARGPALFTLRCARADHSIILARPGASAGPMTITTSYAAQAWPLVGSAIAVRLRADDPTLDRIAFSRGRFTVATPGLATLVLPAWAEPGRVIEDCRA